MFKKLIPVIALALIAGPVLAADPPAGSTDQTASTSKSHKKHHSSSSKKSKSTKPADASSSAPK